MFESAEPASAKLGLGFAMPARVAALPVPGVGYGLGVLSSGSMYPNGKYFGPNVPI